MQYKDLEISSLSMIDLTTGKEVMNISPPSLSSIEQEPFYFSSSEKIEIPMSMSASFDCEPININNLKLLASDPLDSKCTMEMDVPKWTQVRRHRCKRINKKWAKRYGYRVTYKRIGLDIDSIIDNRDGTFNFDFKCDQKKYKELYKDTVIQ
jgi:hypothetical protein